MIFLRQASVPELPTSWLDAPARRHHPALTEMYQSKFGSSREAKPRVLISHPSHTSEPLPSLLIVGFWFDQVSPSLTASWHKLAFGLWWSGMGEQGHGRSRWSLTLTLPHSVSLSLQKRKCPSGTSLLKYLLGQLLSSPIAPSEYLFYFFCPPFLQYLQKAGLPETVAWLGPNPTPSLTRPSAGKCTVRALVWITNAITRKGNVLEAFLSRDVFS